MSGNYSQQNAPSSIGAQAQALTNTFLQGVYKWMAGGLLVTAFVAWSVAHSEAALNLIYNNPFMFYGLIIAQLGLVFGLSMAIHKLSATAASGMFLLYSALNGATLSYIFLIYELGSVVQIFVASAGMFAGMSIYGLVTKRDLTSIGSFLFMGLIGVLIASVINIFLRSSAMEFVISVIGVVVFLGLTAYDTQKLRAMGESAPMDDTVAVRRGTILGALQLYLDFINLFIMMLRLFADRR